MLKKIKNWFFQKTRPGICLNIWGGSYNGLVPSPGHCRTSWVNSFYIGFAQAHCVHLYQPGFSDDYATLFQNRVDRALCHNTKNIIDRALCHDTENRLGRVLCHTTQNRDARALHLYQPGFSGHSAILIENRVDRALCHNTENRLGRALCHNTENRVDRALHLYLIIFSDHSAILIQNRLGRVLCQVYLVVVWQSTLPSLFCTSVAEYSAKPIQSSYYNRDYIHKIQESGTSFFNPISSIS